MEVEWFAGYWSVGESHWSWCGMYFYLAHLMGAKRAQRQCIDKAWIHVCVRVSLSVCGCIYIVCATAYYKPACTHARWCQSTWRTHTRCTHTRRNRVIRLIFIYLFIFCNRYLCLDVQSAEWTVLIYGILRGESKLLSFASWIHQSLCFFFSILYANLLLLFYLY